MKKFMALAVLLVLAAGAYFWWQGSDDKKSDKEHAQSGAASMPPTEVSVVTIKPQSVEFTRDLPGRTAPYKISEIRPQVNGIVLKRFFEEGSEVTEGQQLYQIDPSTYQAAYNSALADLMKAEAGLKTAQSKYKRNEKLVKSGIVSEQSFDDVTAGLDQGKADVAIAKAALATAKINLDYTKVFSPISGRIGKSAVTEGALVTANQPAALATVQQFDPIYVDVTQSSSELMDLQRQLSTSSETPGKTAVKLLLDGDSKVYEHTGELQFSDVTVDQTTGSVQLRVLFANPDHALLPGLFVRARVEQARVDNAILVPQKAITRNADGSVTVWSVGTGDKVAVRPIEVSHAIGDNWLVTKGLNEGDRVIVEGIQKVKPDAVVKPVELKIGAQDKAEAEAAKGAGAVPETPPEPADKQ